MKYSTIYADPPWPFRSKGPSVRGYKQKEPYRRPITCPYKLMSIDEIKSLPIESKLNTDAHLYLWTVNSFICEAHEVARAWGFEPKTILTWGKLQKNKKPFGKVGFYFRSATEHILFAVRGSLKTKHPTDPTLFLLEREEEHSKKPDFFYHLIERQSPGPYLELFARRQRMRPGWFQWGNEIKSSDVVSETEDIKEHHKKGFGIQ